MSQAEAPVVSVDLRLGIPAIGTNTETHIVSAAYRVSNEGESIDLSVIVVTYNEEARIESCLTSVFSACEGLDFEVILVDSNSTDRTVERASDFPISILRIPDDRVTTPGAGRYVGTAHARGDRLLFVDGDMIIESTWLHHAIEQLDVAPMIAAVDGHLNEENESKTPQLVEYVRGVALYDRDAIAAVGGFNPHLKSLEDVHLGYTLSHAGYRLIRLPEAAASHPEPQPFREGLRRWRRGYTVGPGQVLRESIGSPTLFVKYCARSRYRLVVLGWIILGMFSMLWMPLIAVWVLFSLAGFGYLATRLGFIGAANFLYAKILDIIGLGRGLLITPQPPESFPIDRVEVVQRGSAIKSIPQKNEK